MRHESRRAETREQEKRGVKTGDFHCYIAVRVAAVVNGWDYSLRRYEGWCPPGWRICLFGFIGTVVILAEASDAINWGIFTG